MNVMPSTSDLNPGKPAVQFALGERQIAALGFVAFLILGSLTAVAYIAGRAGTAPAAPSAAAAGAPQTKPEPAKSQATSAPVETARALPPSVEKLIVVETATAAGSVPASAPAVAATPAAPPPAASAIPSAAKPQAGSTVVVASDKLAKQSFWQVAALDRKMADDAYAGLMQQNFPVLIAEGPSPDVFRVLVGPLSGPDHTAKMKAALESGGFQPFFKRY